MRLQSEFASWLYVFAKWPPLPSLGVDLTILQVDEPKYFTYLARKTNFRVEINGK